MNVLIEYNQSSSYFKDSAVQPHQPQHVEPEMSWGPSQAELSCDPVLSWHWQILSSCPNTKVNTALWKILCLWYLSLFGSMSISGMNALKFIYLSIQRETLRITKPSKSQTMCLKLSFKSTTNCIHVHCTAARYSTSRLPHQMNNCER